MRSAVLPGHEIGDFLKPMLLACVIVAVDGTNQNSQSCTSVILLRRIILYNII